MVPSAVEELKRPTTPTRGTALGLLAAGIGQSKVRENNGDPQGSGGKEKYSAQGSGYACTRIKF